MSSQKGMHDVRSFAADVYTLFAQQGQQPSGELLA